LLLRKLLVLLAMVAATVALLGASHTSDPCPDGPAFVGGAISLIGSIYYRVKKTKKTE
jgi:hypothetical protein